MAWSLRFVLICAALSACVTYREDLNRGQRLYEENQYEHALAIWRSLEPDTDSLSFNDQARYAYLRGMTDFRLGFRPDARHWLAIAKATEQEHPGGLAPEWNERLGTSLDDLNRDAYGGGDQADTLVVKTTTSPDAKSPEAPAPGRDLSPP
jgi:hypothetical protein